MGIDTGEGTSISFTTSLFSANIVSIGEIGEDYEVIPTTHLGTSDAKTYMLGELSNAAEIVLTTQWDPDKLPPAGAAEETITITFDDGETCSFTGICPGYRLSGVEVDGLLMGTVRVQPSGELTWSTE